MKVPGETFPGRESFNFAFQIKKLFHKIIEISRKAAQGLIKRPHTDILSKDLTPFPLLEGEGDFIVTFLHFFQNFHFVVLLFWIFRIKE